MAMSATAGGERGQSPLPGLYVAQHYFLDSASGPYRCFKVGSTRDLRARLTHVTFVTCFDSPFRYVFTVETANYEDAKKIERTFFAKHKNRRGVRPSGYYTELAKTVREEINDSLKSILKNLKIENDTLYAPQAPVCDGLGGRALPSNDD